MAERTYTVKFEQAHEGDEKRFERLYGWFVAGGNMSERKGLEGARREAQVVDKFWAISFRPEGLPEHVEGIRKLNLGGGVLTLTQPEYDLVKRYIESVSPRTEFARAYIDLVDWWAGFKPDEEVKPQ